MITLQPLTTDQLDEMYNEIVHSRGELTELEWLETASHEDVIKHFTAIINSDDYEFFVIRKDTKFAGIIETADQGEELLVGYWIGKDYRNQGIASTALTVLTTMVDRQLSAETSVDNPASIRVLEKSGFAVDFTYDNHVWMSFTPASVDKQIELV